MTELANIHRRPRPTGRATEPLELARYTVAGGERVLCGRRIEGEAILIDVPAGHEGRVYLVERDLDQDGHAALKALLADYLATAERTDAVPARVSAIRYTPPRDALLQTAPSTQ